MEIDESKFGHKRKYNRGRVSEGAWVFGMVERGSGRSLTFRVPDRTRETLVTRLVQEFIQPGTVILSDKFSPYFNLNDIGYTHLMVTLFAELNYLPSCSHEQNMQMFVI